MKVILTFIPNCCFCDFRSDLHEFNFTESSWSAVPAAGRRPRARYRATAVVHKNTFVLYGGHDVRTYNVDL